VATIRVQREDFDVGQELAALGDGGQVGALASFVGLVRGNDADGAIAGMELEHYPGMTEKSLQAIVAAAVGRWRILDALVIHRFGPLRPGERIVLVAVSSAHRGDAFAACEYIMDRLKTDAPFWKKETTAEGQRWVDARASDEAAAARWLD